jgi:hypothetical protein
VTWLPSAVLLQQFVPESKTQPSETASSLDSERCWPLPHRIEESGSRKLKTIVSDSNNFAEDQAQMTMTAPQLAAKIRKLPARVRITAEFEDVIARRGKEKKIDNQCQFTPTSPSFLHVDFEPAIREIVPVERATLASCENQSFWIRDAFRAVRNPQREKCSTEPLNLLALGILVIMALHQQVNWAMSATYHAAEES